MSRIETEKVTDSWLIFSCEFLISSGLLFTLSIGFIHVLNNLDILFLKILILFFCSVIILASLKLFIVSIVRLYRLIPFKTHKRCRYTPTCSVYMILALRKYVLVFGLFKGIRRIIRCRPPFGGIDLP